MQAEVRGCPLLAHAHILVFVEKQGDKDNRGKENPKHRKELPLLTGKMGETQTKETEKVRKYNSQASKRKLDAYDDQTLSKFIRKPMPKALKAELRTRFLFCRSDTVFSSMTHECNFNDGKSKLKHNNVPRKKSKNCLF